MSDEHTKPTAVIRPGPHEAQTVELATYPVILGELKLIRKEGGERGVRTDEAINRLAITVQSNFELHGGKIRALEARMDAVEAEKRLLVARVGALEVEKRRIDEELESLRDAKDDADGRLDRTSDRVRAVSEHDLSQEAKIGEEIVRRRQLEADILTTKVDTAVTMKDVQQLKAAILGDDSTKSSPLKRMDLKQWAVLILVAIGGTFEVFKEVRAMLPASALAPMHQIAPPAPSK